MDPNPNENVTQGPPDSSTLPNFYSDCPFIVPRYTVTIVDFIPPPLPNAVIPQEMVLVQDVVPGPALEMVPLPTQEMVPLPTQDMVPLPTQDMVPLLPQPIIAINPASTFYYTYDWIFPPGPVQISETETPVPTGPEPELRPSRGGNAKFCALCKSNGETRDTYESHILKNYKSGIVVCPILRQLVCPNCGSTGDNAHTLKYCPVQKGDNPSKKVPREGRPVRNSTGKWSHLKY